MTDQATLRAAIVAEAQSWVGTAYHHMGRVKIRRDGDRVVHRGGVDCAQLVYMVFRKLELCGDVPLTQYPPDWHLHRDVERYAGVVLEHAHEVKRPPEPGDVLLYKWGRVYAHGSIVVAGGAQPMIVHAQAKARQVVLCRADAGELGGRPTRLFSVFAPA